MPDRPPEPYAQSGERRSLRILGISGSLRADSSNTRLIEAAAFCAPEGMELIAYRDLGHLPFFNPDLDRDPLPAHVAALRTMVGASDGLLICSPEYARGVAGAMKNALDWLVSSFEFPGKPVALINASQRAHDADAHLRLTLRTMNAHFVGGASLTVPLLGRSKSAREIAAEPHLREQIAAALLALRDAITSRGAS